MTSCRVQSIVNLPDKGMISQVDSVEKIEYKFRCRKHSGLQLTSISNSYCSFSIKSFRFSNLMNYSRDHDYHRNLWLSHEEFLAPTCEKEGQHTSPASTSFWNLLAATPDVVNIDAPFPYLQKTRWCNYKTEIISKQYEF